MFSTTTPPDRSQPIASLIQGDPYLACHVIAAAHHRGLSDTEPGTTSLQQAIDRLTVDHVRDLILGVLLTGPLVAAPGYISHRRDLWKWIFGCTMAGDYLAAKQDEDRLTRRFLTDGLVLGIGPLVLMAGLGYRYVRVMGTPLRPLHLRQREWQELGVTHYQVAAWVLESLGVPGNLRQGLYAMAERRQNAIARHGQVTEVLGACIADLQADHAAAWLRKHAEQLSRVGNSVFRAELRQLRKRLAMAMRLYDRHGSTWQLTSFHRQMLTLTAGQTIHRLLGQQLAAGSDDGLSFAAERGS